MSHIRLLHLPLTPAAADRLAASLSRYVPEAEDAPLLDALRTYLDQRLTALEHAFAATNPSSPLPSPSAAAPAPSGAVPPSAQPNSSFVISHSSFGACSASSSLRTLALALETTHLLGPDLRERALPLASRALAEASAIIDLAFPSSSPSSSAQPDSSFFTLHSSFGAPAPLPSSFLRAYLRLLHADPWAPPHEEEDARIRRLLRLIKSNPPTENGEMKP